MTVLNASQIYALARSAGFNAAEAVTATSIALAESGGRSDAVGDVSLQTGKWGPSIGLWQVRSLKAESGKGTTRDATKLTDPAFNARAAYEIYKGSNGWRNWSVFTNGKYQSNVSTVSQAVGAQETAGGDAWWQKVLNAGGWVDVVNPRPDGQSQIGATVNDTVTAVTRTDGVLDQLSGLLNNLSSAEWWKRVGIGAAGVLVILLALVVMVWAGKDKVLKSTVGTAVRSLK